MNGPEPHPDELQELWQGNTEHTWKEDDTVLLRLAQEKQRSLFDVLREQNMSAYLLSLSFAPLTALAAWRGRQSAWLFTGYLLMTLTLAIGALVVWRNARAARRAERLELSRREHQQQLVDFHNARIRFARSVKYWYAAPLFLGAGLVCFRIAWHFLGATWGGLLVGALVLACWLGVWHMHDVRGVADLRRRRDELQQLLDEMDRP